jgi:hypothetical protein
MRTIAILLASLLVVALIVAVATKQGDVESSASPDSTQPAARPGAIDGVGPVTTGTSGQGQSAVAEGRGPGVNPTIDRFGVPVSESLPVQPVPATPGAGGVTPVTAQAQPGSAIGPRQAAQAGPESSATDAPSGDPGIYGDSSGFVESDYIGPAPEDAGASLPDMPPPEAGGIVYDVPPEGFGEQPVGDPPEGTGTK